MVKPLTSGSVPSSSVGGCRMGVLIALQSFYRSAAALSDRFLEMDLISRIMEAGFVCHSPALSCYLSSSRYPSFHPRRWLLDLVFHCPRSRPDRVSIWRTLSPKSRLLSSTLPLSESSMLVFDTPRPLDFINHAKIPRLSIKQMWSFPVNMLRSHFPIKQRRSIARYSSWRSPPCGTINTENPIGTTTWRAHKGRIFYGHLLP